MQYMLIINISCANSLDLDTNEVTADRVYQVVVSKTGQTN